MKMALPAFLPSLFPNSLHEPFIETSEPTEAYNCIAWAYEDITQWYWPHPNRYWPENIPMEVNLETFVKLFEMKGYKVCSDNLLKEGYQKIIIYSDVNNLPTHAARQLSDGHWTSKLGPMHDVSHTIQNMNNGFYGSVAIIMRKELDTTFDPFSK